MNRADDSDSSHSIESGSEYNTKLITKLAKDLPLTRAKKVVVQQNSY